MNPRNRIRFFIDTKTWLKDERIRHLSLKTRAIWLDIVILMFHEEPPHRLTAQGRPMTPLECRLCLNIPIKEFHYLMRDEASGYVKIGQSGDPSVRETTLQAQIPKLSLIAAWKGFAREEAELHKKYAAQRLRGEWFDLKASHISEIFEFFEGREEFNHA